MLSEFGIENKCCVLNAPVCMARGLTSEVQDLN